MAVSNVTVTITAAELYEIARRQVEPSLHEPLLAEINRRWADGHTLVVSVVAPDQSTD